MNKALSSLLVILISGQSFAVPDIASLSAPVNITISSRLGTISDYFPGRNRSNSSPEFILIQDLHVNRSVQKNISDILKTFQDQQLISGSIGVEGAVGFQDLSQMQQYPDAKMRKAAADYLLSQGEMPGAFHFLVTEGKGSAFGVERQDLYDAAIALYQQSYASRTLLDGRLAKLEQGLKALVLDPVLSMKANSLLLKTSRLRKPPRTSGEIADQLRRASMSISANLAEGSGRWHKGDRKQFFWVARASACECVTHLRFAVAVGLIPAEFYPRLKNDLDLIAKMLTKLIAST